MLTDMIEQLEKFAVTKEDVICYQHQEQTYTYHDLKIASDAIASHLDQVDLAEKSPILIYGEMDFSMLAAFIGSVKAGHGYIPVDEHSPVERIEQIIRVAEPSLILATTEFASSITALPPIIESRRIQTILNQAKEQPVDYQITHPVSGDDTFYIIFTSGTTGVPKGVQISHNNLLSFVNWMLSDFNIKNGARFLAQAPFSFDLSVMSLYPALAFGGQLTTLPKEIVDNFKALFATLPKLDVNIWVSTPSFAEICLLSPEFNEQKMPDLTHILFCGEELTKATAAKLLERFPHVKLFNTYGPTEATVAISQVQITPEILANYERLPIGYIKEDTIVTIIDDDGQPLPVMEKGEITISGPNVSKGYLNNPEKTAAAFIEKRNQFPVYLTGDRGTLTEEGLLLYQGRKDFQIKLHGYRIELEDVDHHLEGVSFVKQAISVPKYDKNQKVNQLIGIVVLEDLAQKTQLEWTKALKAEMAQTTISYMIPQRFIFKEKLPLTSNGKIDRKGLIAEVNNG